MHHHHCIPNQPPPAKSQRTGEASLEADEHGPPSMVGQEGMPAPAPKPKDPKLKFTAEDDALLVELKTTKNLTWKQISDFPQVEVGYASGQILHQAQGEDDCMDGRHAMDDYEADRWRIISGNVGNGFSAAACTEKAMNLVQPDVAVPSTEANGGKLKPTDKRDTRAVVIAASPALHTKDMTCIGEVGSDVTEAEGV
nr:hypothetical protein B0A51_04774 [Rachicladosporium sp. CCFEE 5018]